MSGANVAAEGQGRTLFRISKTKVPLHLAHGRYEAGFDAALLERFCLTEEWSGDLGNGLFQIGRLSQELHGLGTQECGLLTLLRCYDAADRVRVLELLENASSAASSFCFSTYIISGPGERQPIVCI